MRFSLLLAASANSKLRSMLLAGMFILFAPALHAATIYVDRDASGSDSGADWTNAYRLLQNGLAAASSGDEVWVAEGIYFPDELSDGNREATFQLKNGVAILGGFAGTEVSREQRRPHKHPVRLSGDLDQNDTQKELDGCSHSAGAEELKGNNSYHVVTAIGTDATAILNGFTICNGLANGTGAHEHGAGIRSENSSPTLSRLIVKSNRAGTEDGGQGGGMYSTGDPTITDVEFRSNFTHVEQFAGSYNLHFWGGGLKSYGNPSLTRVIFRGNGSNIGGGMTSKGGKPVLNQVAFIDNTAYDGGGGLFVHGNTILNDVHFERNVTWYIDNETSLELPGGGGGMAIIGGHLVTLTNVTFAGNAAKQPDAFVSCTSARGGGLFIWNGSDDPESKFELNNVVFQGNLSNAGGGALAINGSVYGIATNVTFAGNQIKHDGAACGHYGSALFTQQYDGGSTLLRNSIIWDNLGSAVYAAIQGSTVFSDSLVQDCGDSWSPSSTCGTDGGSNHTPSDPQFVEPVVLLNRPTVEGNLRLKLGSTALDVGNNGVIQSGVTTDADGRQRIRNTTVDLGAYELPVRCDATATKLYVDRDATGDNTGLDWDNALYTLQDALFMRDSNFCVSSQATEIWVAEGIYYTNEGPYTNPEPYTDIPRDDSFYYPSSTLRIYGGFQGNETSRDQRDWDAHPTVLSADVQRNDIQTNGVLASADDIVGVNSFHVFHSTIPGETELDGFTLTGGNANRDSTDPAVFSMKGGGFVGINTDTQLRHLIVSGNSALQGGGMFLEDSGSTLEDITFFGNYAGGNDHKGGGGGLHLLQSSGVSLVDVDFVNNHSAWAGGGMYNSLSSPSISNSIFSSNSARQGPGGAILNELGSSTFTNVLIVGNSSTAGGGGMANQDSTVLLTNVTISGNRSSGRGGGIANIGIGFGMNLTLQNSVIWNNQDVNGTAAHESSLWNKVGRPSISFSDVQHCGGGSTAWVTSCGIDGGNNLDLDPTFVTPTDPAAAPSTSGNLHLQAASPAIDTGHSAFNSTAVDLDGLHRINDGNSDGHPVIDMGPYEAPAIALGAIAVNKATDPPGSQQLFEFSLTGGPSSISKTFSLKDGGTEWTNQLAAGTYSVSELEPVGWKQSAVLCTGGFGADSIVLAAGETVTCNFTNTELHASVSIDKSASPESYVLLGESIAYQFDVENTGDLELTDVTVTDPLSGLSTIDCGNGSHTIASLPVSATATCKATYHINQADLDAGSVTNKASVTAKDPLDKVVTADSNEVVIWEEYADMDIMKSASPESYVLLDDTITYLFDVLNTGEVELTDVTVTDPLSGLSKIDCGNGSNTIASLLPTETGDCAATYHITQADLDAGHVVNTASVSAKDPHGNVIKVDSNKVIILESEVECLSGALIIPDGEVFTQDTTLSSAVSISTATPPASGVIVKAPNTLTLLAPEVEFNPLFRTEGDADPQNPPGGGQLKVIIGKVTCP